MLGGRLYPQAVGTWTEDRFEVRVFDKHIQCPWFDGVIPASRSALEYGASLVDLVWFGTWKGPHTLFR